MSINRIEIDNEEQTVRDMYEETKLKILRLYMCTKRFTAHDIPTKSPERLRDEPKDVWKASDSPSTSTSESPTLPTLHHKPKRRIPATVTSNEYLSTSITPKPDNEDLLVISTSASNEYLHTSPNFVFSASSQHPNNLEDRIVSPSYDYDSSFNCAPNLNDDQLTAYFPDCDLPIAEYDDTVLNTQNTLPSFYEYADGSDREITFRSQLPDSSSLINAEWPGDALSLHNNSNSDNSDRVNASNTTQYSIRIRRGFALEDLKCAFVDNPEFIDRNLKLEIIESNGKSETAEGIGVFRDILTEFWQSVYERCTLGAHVKVPFIWHDYQEKDWRAIAQIFVKGWLVLEYLPLKIVAPFINEVLCSKNSDSDLLDSFLLYIATSEKETLKASIEDIDSVDMDDLLEVLDSYNCKVKPTKDNIKTVVLQIAHKELIQAPMFVIDCWRPVVKQLRNVLSDELLSSMRKSKMPTARNIAKHIIFPEVMSKSDQEISKYLLKYIKESSCDNRLCFLRFCTGSDMLLGQYITVYFMEMGDFERRPVSRTCTSMLQLSSTIYELPRISIRI